MLLGIALSVYGCMILVGPKHKSQYTYGILCGTSGLMCNWFLCQAVQTGEDPSPYSATKGAMVFFETFLFLCYLADTIMLVKFRAQIMGNGDEQKEQLTHALDGGMGPDMTSVATHVPPGQMYDDGLSLPQAGVVESYAPPPSHNQV